MSKTKKTTKKDIAWGLYAQGFKPDSPEVEAVLKEAKIKRGTAREYYYRWDKAGRPGYISRQAEEAALKPTLPESASTEHEPKKQESLKLAPTVSITDAAFRVTPDRGYISIGHISIPYQDFGYSSTHNLLLVSATYDQVCRPRDKGGFEYEGKLGDFCADCVELFRRVFRFDKLREEEIRHAEETGVRLLGGAGEGESFERESEEAESQ